MAKTFLQGHGLTLTVCWQDGVGNLVDVYDPSDPSNAGTRITVMLGEDEIIDNVLMSHSSTGTFTYTLTLHQSVWPAGIYEVHYSALSALSEPLSFTETFEVLESESYAANEAGYFVLSDLLPALERQLDNGPFTSMSEVLYGVADGANRIFALPNTPAVYESETIIVNDGGSALEQERGEDYTITYDNGFVVFATAPPVGSYITATYRYKRHTTEALIDFITSSVQQVSRRANLEWTILPGDQGYMLNFDPAPYADLIFLGARIAREINALSDDAANAVDWSELGTSVKRSRAAESRSIAIEEIRSKFDQELKSLAYEQSIGLRLESGMVDLEYGADYKLASRVDAFTAGW